MSRWETMARQDLHGELLYRFYEAAGRYEYAAGMSREDADKRAFLEVVRHER